MTTRRVERLNVSATPPQKERWTQAADADGLPLPEWARRMLDAAAEQSIERHERRAR